MMARIAAFLAIFAIFGGTAAAQPAGEGPDFRQYGAFFVDPGQPDVIYLNGQIDDSTLLDFRRARRAFPDLATIVLNSPGGFLRTALAIADEANDAGMATVIPGWAACYSACAYIFLAGVERFALGELGVHQFAADEPDIEDAQRAMADLFEFLGRFDTPPDVMTIMLRTPPDEMYVFTPDEIADLALNRGFADGAEAFEAAGEYLPALVGMQRLAADAYLNVDPDGRESEIKGIAEWRLGEDEGRVLALAELDFENGDAINLVIGGPSLEDDLPGFILGIWADSALVNGNDDRMVEVVLVGQGGRSRPTLTSFGHIDYDTAESQFFLSSLRRWLAFDLSAIANADYLDIWFTGGGQTDVVLRVGLTEDIRELLSEAVLAWQDAIEDFGIGDDPDTEIARTAFVYEADDALAIEAEAVWYIAGSELAARIEIPERDLLIDVAFDQGTIYVLLQPPHLFVDAPSAVRAISVDSDLRWSQSGSGLFVADLATADPRRMATLLRRDEGIELLLTYQSGDIVQVFIDKGDSFERLLDQIEEVWAGDAGAPAAVAAQPAFDEIDLPPEKRQGRMPNYNLPPTYGAVTLRSGFLPDPHRVILQSGGVISAANSIGEGCLGFVAEAPDYRLQYTADEYMLFISVVSEFDTTLLVNDPAGNWHCDDDSGDGLNPAISWDNPLSGQYDIWIGTFGGTTIHDAELFISEIGYGRNPGGAAPIAGGGDPENVAAYRDWEVIIVSGTCYALTAAIDTDPPGSRYGPSYLEIEVLPSGDGFYPHVMFDYQLSTSFYVTGFIDEGRAFDFIVSDEGDYATLFGTHEQSEVLAQMRRGTYMDVASVTADGENRWDRFSLLGMTAAYNRAVAECGG